MRYASAGTILVVDDESQNVTVFKPGDAIPMLGADHQHPAIHAQWSSGASDGRATWGQSPSRN